MAETDKLPAFASMEEAEYAYDMGIIKLRQPRPRALQSKFDDTPLATLEVSDHELPSTAHGLHAVGQVMDVYTRGERKMVIAPDIAAFGVAALDAREALRKLELLGATWRRNG